MNDYISREDVQGQIVKAAEKYQIKLFDKSVNVILQILQNMPAADVQLVKRGEWDFQGYQLFKCTNCKEIFTQNQLEAMQNHIDQEEFAFPNFCPHCGARMIKDGDTNG